MATSSGSLSFGRIRPSGRGAGAKPARFDGITEPWALLLAIALVAAACLSAPATAEAGGRAWRTADEPQPGYNLTKVCLAQLNGRWTEFPAEDPASCEEMLVVARDSREIWPDKAFYQRHVEPHASRIYEIKDKYALGYLFSQRPGMVLHALTESGALRRLDEEVARGVKNPELAACEQAFDRAETEQDVRAAADCMEFTPLKEKAFRRIRDEKDRAEKRQQEAEAAKSRPECSMVSVHGIVVGSPWNVATVNAAADLEDLLARNPLFCAPSGFTQLYGCEGAAWMSGRTGYIIGWGDGHYQIAVPVDLTIGRKDALLYIDRAGVSCIDQEPPELDFAENWQRFMRNHNAYR